MSAEARDYVWQHSPYVGATFTIHLAIAEIVNPANDYRYWVSASKTAEMTRCSEKSVFRILPDLVADGYLEVVDDRQHASAGEARRSYRFLFPTPDTLSTVELPTPDTMSTVDVSTPDISSLTPDISSLHIRKEPKEPKSSSSNRLLARAFLIVGRNKLDADGRSGNDGLARHIGQEDFGDELRELHELHPDWSAEQIAAEVEDNPVSSATGMRLSHFRQGDNFHVATGAQSTYCEEHHTIREGFDGCEAMGLHKVDRIPA